MPRGGRWSGTLLAGWSFKLSCARHWIDNCLGFRNGGDGDRGEEHNKNFTTNCVVDKKWLMVVAQSQFSRHLRWYLIKGTRQVVQVVLGYTSHIVCRLKGPTRGASSPFTPFSALCSLLTFCLLLGLYDNYRVTCQGGEVQLNYRTAKCCWFFCWVETNNRWVGNRPMKWREVEEEAERGLS